MRWHSSAKPAPDQAKKPRRFKLWQTCTVEELAVTY
jgi:hypothetical protein